MQTVWQLQEAKSKLSKLIKKTTKEPQVITVHGEKRAVVLSFEEYQHLLKPTSTLVQFFQQSPLAKINLKLERMQDTGRNIKL